MPKIGTLDLILLFILVPLPIVNLNKQLVTV